ncbi:hypothetical protein BGZ58_006847 [Dissophora ornata]|nr:hypothetical protein BGZ58_006847 [Dissophora ornata]
MDPPDSFLLTDAETRSSDDFFLKHKKVFFESHLLLQQLQLQQQQQQQHRNQDDQHEDQTDGDDNEETDSQGTAWSRLGIDSPLNQSSSTLADTTTVLFMTDAVIGAEGDALESLVQTLQSEVKDTRATVYELEDRLDLAEHSNRRIVEELKMLLADAEVVLRNAEKPTGDDSSPSSHKNGSAGIDDSNIVYNRICVALQALIDEAQVALHKNAAAKQTLSNTGDEALTSPPNEEISTQDTTILLDRPHRSEHDLARRISHRSSLTLLNPIKIHTDDSQAHELANSPTSYYSAKDEVSRIYWKQKHEEQHDRYRKSCHRLTLELEGRFLTTDSDDSDASRSSQRHWGPSSSAQSSMPSTPTTPTQPLQGILRTSKKDGTKRERHKKRCQVQFLNADIPETRQDTAVSTTLYRQKEQEPKQKQRQYTSRSVGSTRSRGVVLQLYELWQHTWLRTRIMHVITGSVEIVIIIWVVIKASRMTLTWFGVQPSTINQWVTFIYGDRGGAGAGAKDLYAKIRKDGLQLRQIKAWSQREPEALIVDIVAGAAASTSLISPSKMVYGPTKRVMMHAATGVALAFLSDGARRLVRRL